MVEYVSDFNQQRQMSSECCDMRCQYLSFKQIAPRSSIIESISHRSDKRNCQNCENGISSTFGQKSSEKKSESTPTIFWFDKNTIFFHIVIQLNMKFCLIFTASKKSQNW